MNDLAYIYGENVNVFPILLGRIIAPSIKEILRKKTRLFSVVLIGTCLLPRVLAATQREERVRKSKGNEPHC
jgi:hypothetical protein